MRRWFVIVCQYVVQSMEMEICAALYNSVQEQIQSSYCHIKGKWMFMHIWFDFFSTNTISFAFAAQFCAVHFGMVRLHTAGGNTPYNEQLDRQRYKTKP